MHHQVPYVDKESVINRWSGHHIKQENSQQPPEYVGPHYWPKYYGPLIQIEAQRVIGLPRNECVQKTQAFPLVSLLNKPGRN